MIQVDDLRKEYDGLVAVDDVSFEARPGEIFGLLGPNGAGKSTTIGCISGLLTPTSGAVRVQGYDVARDPVAAKSRMGIVPQEVALYEDLPAEENLRFWAQAYGLRGGRAAERSGPSSRPWAGGPRRRSGRDVQRRMKRRLNFGCGIVHEPESAAPGRAHGGSGPPEPRPTLDLVREQAGAGVCVLYTPTTWRKRRHSATGSRSSTTEDHRRGDAGGASRKGG
jgi:ABC-2 type transport system ATP-binding protein